MRSLTPRTGLRAGWCWIAPAMAQRSREPCLVMCPRVTRVILAISSLISVRSEATPSGAARWGLAPARKTGEDQ